MTARIRIYKVGPFEDGDSLYVPAGVDNGKPTDLDPVLARDDLAGVRGIIAQRKHEVLVCEPALEAAARECGLEVEELPADYVATRINTAMAIAQGEALDKVVSTWAYLRLMTAVIGLVRHDVFSRWPARQAFDVELRRDRSRTFSGWLGPGPSICLVDSDTDAKSLALSSSEEQAERLASLDHLRMELVAPPSYALVHIRDFYKIEVMPRFAKRAGGKAVLADDEDALVMAGVAAALANFRSIEFLCWADTSTPGREVRTYISAGLPFPLVDL